jgi:hypothetical protein
MSRGHQAQKLGCIDELHLEKTLGEAYDFVFVSDEEIVRTAISVFPKLDCFGFRNFVEQGDQHPHVTVDSQFVRPQFEDVLGACDCYGDPVHHSETFGASDNGAPACVVRTDVDAPHFKAKAPSDNCVSCLVVCGGEQVSVHFFGTGGIVAVGRRGTWLAFRSAISSSTNRLYVSNSTSRSSNRKTGTF